MTSRFNAPPPSSSSHSASGKISPGSPRQTPSGTVQGNTADGQDRLVGMDAARLEIRRCAILISEARQKMGDGHMVDLAVLESMIRATCIQVLELPRDQGRRLRGDLEAVLYDLDALETDMTSRFGGLARRPVHDGPRPPTVGAAYQAGVDRAARLSRTQPPSSTHSSSKEDKSK